MRFSTFVDMYSAQPSYWEKTTFLSDIDIAIIGAGLVGTCAAYYLKKKYPKAKIVVFDRGFISSGASTKNAGFACFGSISELIDDLKNSDTHQVFELLAKRYEGMMNLLSLCGEENIDFEQKGGYEVFQIENNSFAKECVDQIYFFNTQTKGITGLEQTYQLEEQKISAANLSNIGRCIFNKAEGQINPGKMMQRLYDLAIQEGVLFYQGIEVMDIEDHIEAAQIKLANGWELKSKKLLIANNGFAKKLIPQLEIEAVRNQVLLTSPISDLSLSGCFHMDKGYFYFRDIDSRVLIGGGRHLDKEGETTNSFGRNTLIEDALIQLLNDIILKGRPYRIEHKWSGILGVGNHKHPILRRESENVYLAVRLGGMGVALGSLLAKEAAEMI